MFEKLARLFKIKDLFSHDENKGGPLTEIEFEARREYVRQLELPYLRRGGLNFHEVTFDGPIHAYEPNHPSGEIATLEDAQYVIRKRASIFKDTITTYLPFYDVPETKNNGLFELMFAITSRVSPEVDSSKDVYHKLDELLAVGVDSHKIEFAKWQLHLMNRVGFDTISNQRLPTYMSMYKHDVERMEHPDYIVDGEQKYGAVWIFSGKELHVFEGYPEDLVDDKFFKDWFRENGDLSMNSVIVTPTYVDYNIGGVRFRIPAQRIDDSDTAQQFSSYSVARKHAKVETYGQPGEVFICNVKHGDRSDGTEYYREVSGLVNLPNPGTQGGTEIGEPMQIFVQIKSLPGEMTPQQQSQPLSSLQPVPAGQPA